MIIPFLANVPILYLLKTPEKPQVSIVFKGYKIGTLAGNGLAEFSRFLLTLPVCMLDLIKLIPVLS